MQVSSRTDKGVHALKNTLHVDLRTRPEKIQDNNSTSTNHRWEPQYPALSPVTIQRALNFYLRRPKSRQGSSYYSSHLFGRGENDIRILNVVPAPLITNGQHASTTYEWNARFTAIRRQYVYRILTGSCQEDLDPILPFEWDRAWFVPMKRQQQSMNVSLMQEAANILIGTHDFTSFRGKNCQRPSPITTLSNLSVNMHTRYKRLGCLEEEPFSQQSPEINLITISVTGTSFLYRQVRNIVGCLVHVGQGKLSPLQVEQIMHAKNRKIAPPMAPAHGLFLVDVEHQGLQL